MINGCIDEFVPIINIDGVFCCKIKIGTKIPITTEEIIRKISKFRHYYYDGKIIIETDVKDEFVLDIIKKINMINLKCELVLGGVVYE